MHPQQRIPWQIVFHPGCDKGGFQDPQTSLRVGVMYVVDTLLGAIRRTPSDPVPNPLATLFVGLCHLFFHQEIYPFQTLFEISDTDEDLADIRILLLRPNIDIVTILRPAIVVHLNTFEVVASIEVECGSTL